MKVSLVLFDIDGTLIRTGGAGVWAFGETAARLYGRPGATDAMHFHGRTDRSLVCEFLRQEGLPVTETEIQRFFDGYLGHLKSRLDQHAGEVCPGVRELIQALRSHQDAPQLGVLTGNISRGADLKLGAHGLQDLLGFGVFGEDNEHRNNLAFNALEMAKVRFGNGLSGGNILIVGDTPADIECARAIGARCLAVATGGNSFEELLEHSPTWAVRSLEGFNPHNLLHLGSFQGGPTDWESLYHLGDTHWDKGEPAPGLVDFLSDHPDLEGARVLVPGCGRGHDTIPWQRKGGDVLGIDLSPRAVDEARCRYADGGGHRFSVSDFLAGPGSHGCFDWVFEHTLWCAISPDRRRDYVASVTAAVRPGGHYLAINYMQPSDPVGPPHAVTVAELHQRLAPHFELCRHWIPRSFPGREGRERMFLWRRRA
jgi:phosphoglycolate phosphatase-like HAD superfamily hydrolase